MTRSIGGLESGGFKCLGKKTMKTDKDGRELVTKRRLSGASAACPIASGEKQKGQGVKSETKDTSQNQRTIYYQAKEQKRS